MPMDIMELIVDSEPRSITAKVLNTYSRANIKLIEVSKHTAEHLKLSLPALSSKDLISYPLSIYTTICEISKTSPFLLGESSIEKAQISSWIELSTTVSNKDFIDYLEKKLLSRTFLVSNHITVADISSYAIVKKTIGGITFGEKDQFPCIMRWASHLMSLPGLKDCLPPFEVPYKVNKVMEAYENYFKQNTSTENAQKTIEEAKKPQEEEKKKPAEKAKKVPAENAKKAPAAQEKKKQEGEAEGEKKAQPKQQKLKKVLTEEQKKEIEDKKQQAKIKKENAPKPQPGQEKKKAEAPKKPEDKPQDQ